MRTGVVAAAIAVLAAGCPRPSSAPPPAPAELSREDRVQIARLEAQRAVGAPKLLELAGDRSPARRALALRALGRVGGPAATQALRARLTGPDAAAAAAALGLIAATGGLEPAEATQIATELVAAGGSGAARVAVLEALGRVGDPAGLPTLASGLGSDDPAVAAAAGLALARLGRAKVALDETTELAAIARARDGNDAVRYAATAALARAFVDPAAPPPAATDPVVRALRDRLSDSDALVRATAVQGLAARRAVPVATPVLLDRLGDTDWRVGVELVRALGGASGTPETKVAVVPYLARVAGEWSAGRAGPAFAHVLLEGLRQLTERAAEPQVRSLLVTLARAFADEPPRQRAPELRLASAWASCLALAALARPVVKIPPGDALGDPQVALSQLATCGDQLVPEHEVQRLTLEVIAAGGASERVRRVAMATSHGDPRIAGAAATLLPGLWKDASAADRVTLRDALITAVGRAEAAAAGSAVEAAGTLLAAQGAAGELAPLAAAVVAKLASAGDDVELVTTVLTAIAAAKLDGLPACQQLRTAASPAVRQAARTCVKDLTGEDPGPALAATNLASPPIDPLVGLGAKTWRLTTTQGDVVISLAGDLAPWHVGAIVTLTREGFYDGLTFHRVVPDFVVQGGDPTGSGWGGPGFTLPSEVGSSVDVPVPAFGPGAVGIADAGKDTGGSQWFAMHGRAPHLDGRYTWIGQVVDGQDVIDRLQIGDRIVRARIE